MYYKQSLRKFWDRLGINAIVCWLIDVDQRVFTTSLLSQSFMKMYTIVLYSYMARFPFDLQE